MVGIFGRASLELLLAVAGADEDRPSAHRPPQAEVGAVVADDPRSGRVEPERGGRALDHERAGFAARAALVRPVRTELDPVQRHAVDGEQLPETRVDPVELDDGEHPAADRGLVRQDDEAETQIPELAKGVRRAGDQPELVGPEHVPDLLVDRAVAVEQDEPAAHEGLHTRTPARASTPWCRNANSANWPPSASSAERTAGCRSGVHASSR